jgi:rubrerythrin
VDFPWFTKTFQSNLLPSGVNNENVGFPEIARRLRAIIRAEEHHGVGYKKSLKEVEGGSEIKKGRKDCWVCRRYGYIHEGEASPEKCPSCDHELNYFQVKCEEY